MPSKSNKRTASSAELQSSASSSRSGSKQKIDKRTKVVEISKEAEEEAALSTLQNVDIKKIMTSDSPEVKCVLLKMDGSSEEIKLDMSPRLKLSQATLGGEITFLGQWETIETIIVIRKDQQASKKLKLNKHKLQPPFHNAKVYGDILLMCSDEHGDPKDIALKDYISFTKLDIPEWEPEEEEDEEDDDDEENDEEEDDDEEEDEEAQQAAIMAYLAPKIIERFKTEHDREPTEEELSALTGTLLQNLAQPKE